MPPPPGEAPTTLLYLQKQLSRSSSSSRSTRRFAQEAAAADLVGSDGGLDDRQADAADAPLVQGAAASGRERRPDPEPVQELVLGGPWLGSALMLRDERERPLPRVVRGLGVLGELPVEEAVRRTVVGDQLEVDARSGEGRSEGGVVLRRDVRVVARLERQDRRLELGRALVGPGLGRSARPASRRSRSHRPAHGLRRPRAMSCGRRSRTRR